MSLSFNLESSCNLEAIRLNIIKQVQKKRQQQSLISSSHQDNNNNNNDSNNNIPTTSLMNHGLPSPPVEYQKQKTNKKNETLNNTQQEDEDEDQDDDTVSTISSLPPSTSPSTSTITTTINNNNIPFTAQDASSSSLPASSTSFMNSNLTIEQIEEKIYALKQEKHQLFTKMKDLIKKEENPVITSKPLESVVTTTKLPPSPLKLSLPSPSPSPSPSPTTTPKISQQPCHKSSLASPSSLSSPRTSSYPYTYYQRPLSSSSSSSSYSSSNPTSPTSFNTPNSPRYYRSNNNHHPSDRYRYNPYHRSLSSSNLPPMGYKIRRTSSHFIPRKPIPNNRPSNFRSRQIMDRHIPRY